LYEGSLQEAQTRIGELAKRDGKDMNAIMEGGKRAAMALLKDSPKTLEKLNTFLGNDPDIMYALARMGEALGEDTAELGGTVTANNTDFDDAQKIMADPKHPEHELWLKENGKGPITAKIAAAYNRKFPGRINLS
jgi:hypothetical protein